MSVPPSRSVPRLAWRDGAFIPGDRVVPVEMALAISFNRQSHAVMMATPADLEDFALGFSLSEGIVEAAGEIEDAEVVELPDGEPDGEPDGKPHDGSPRGIELRLWIGEERMRSLDARRRHVAGPTGCGLCGLESLEAALRPPRPVPAGRMFQAAEIQRAVASLRPAQCLNHATRAVHAAGFWTPEHGLVALREDVGRHNALDKLHGALARCGRTASDGVVVVTSRISVELVQKAATMGAPVLAAVSAPTTLALAMAERAGMTLVAVAREDGFELCCGAGRIVDAAPNRLGAG